MIVNACAGVDAHLFDASSKKSQNF